MTQEICLMGLGDPFALLMSHSSCPIKGATYENEVAKNDFTWKLFGPKGDAKTRKTKLTKVTGTVSVNDGPEEPMDVETFLEDEE